MASPGGIPRLLYEESVRDPLLPPATAGLPPAVGGTTSNSDSRPRNFTAALNPRKGSSEYRPLESPEEVTLSPESTLPRRYNPRAFASAVDESGTMINARSIENRSSEAPGFQEYVHYQRDSNRTKFEEAALYVKEGEDNNKFASHPNGKYSKIAYHLVHHPVVYLTDFVVSCLLLSLAIIEEPSWISYPADYKAMVTGIHGALELLLLTIIGFNIILRVIWMKPKTFLRQRAMIAALVLTLMYIEAMVVLFRQRNHFRITRSLRIIFFVDSFIVVGVRRVLRQIFQCLKPILDVMILLFFMMAIFALMGYYLFATSDPSYFDSYLKAFVSLFITLTTANHPDVYMEAYVRNHWSPLFFVLYLFVTLYFFSNVLLAVVYAHFNDEEKNKFKKLFLHKREALKLAFQVLSKDNAGITYHDFLQFMLEYKPRIPEYQVMCIFKGLRTDSSLAVSDKLHRDDFMNFYEFQNLKWRQVDDEGFAIEWYDEFPKKVKPFFRGLNTIVHFRYFNSIMAFIVMLNALYLVLFTLITSFHCGRDGANKVTLEVKESSKYCAGERFTASYKAIIGSFIFIAIYLVEISVRILAVGPVDYFRKIWNRFDFVVIIASFVLLCIEADAGDHEVLRYLIVVRPIKLVRLLRLRRRYFDIMNTVFVLAHRLLSVLLLLFMIYYFFAIIGMEVFQGRVFVGCCNRALYGVGGEYSANATVFSSQTYWLNNFDNIYQSYVILYEEMVVNNWFVQMEGFVSETNIAARVFFMGFWCTTTVCLSVIIAYIVDAFVFRIQSSQKKKRCNKHKDLFECNCHQKLKKTVEVTLTGSEINQIKYEATLFEEVNRTRGRMKNSLNLFIRRFRRIDFDLIPSRVVSFSGKRLRTKEDLNLQMYRSELEGWITERDQQLEKMRYSKPKTFKDVLKSKTKEFLLFLLD